MTEYTFSVFTPSYNRAKTLPRLYEALKRQTYRNFEWIIVDDGSADNTKKKRLRNSSATDPTLT